MINENELVQVFDDFINDRGLWEEFKEYIAAKGYKLSDLGFADEEE